MHTTTISPFLQFSILLAILLFAAKISGYFSTRIGQPAVLGELLVGLFLGPSLLNIGQWSLVSNEFIGEFIYELGELGVLLLMFLAGLELHLSDLARNRKVSMYAGVLGVVLPAGLGWLISTLFGMEWHHAMFLGLTLAATSVSISAQTLIEIKALRTRVGLSLLGAAVIDDILAILLLSTFLALVEGSGGLGSILLVMGKMILFLALSAVFGIWVLPRVTKRIARLPISQGSLTFAVVVLLIYGVAAEVVGGMAAITGTFLAGLMFSRTPEKNQIETGLATLTYGLFAPIFFISIGLSVDLHTVQPSALWLLLAITAAAVIGKVAGAGLGGRLGRLSWAESLQLGIGMISRGEVGLIIAREGVKNNLITNDGLSAIIGMILLTTLITPPLLRNAFHRFPSATPPPSKSVLQPKQETAQ